MWSAYPKELMFLFPRFLKNHAIFLKCVVYLKSRKREVGKDKAKERSLNHWFTYLKPVTARPGPGTPSGSPILVAETQLLGSSSVSSQSLHKREAGIRSRK